jgi:hypothetical protein
MKKNSLSPLLAIIFLLLLSFNLQAQHHSGNHDHDSTVLMCNPNGHHTMAVKLEQVQNKVDHGWSIGPCPTAPPLVCYASTNKIYCNGSTAIVTVTAEGGYPPYTGVGEFEKKAGTYQFTVKDADGNEASTSATLTEPNVIVLSLTSTEILCKGETSVVNVSASGGAEPYSGIGDFVVTAGTYYYSFHDANGCRFYPSITVTEPDQLVASIAPLSTVSAKTCPFGTDANIVIGYGSSSIRLSGSAAGGTGAKTYSWSPSTGLSDPNVANPVFTPSLTSGCANYSFTLTVTDANGCTSTATTLVKVVNVAANGGNVMICHSNGNNSSVVLSVKSNKVASYLNSGDCLGSCNMVCSNSSGKTSETATEEVVVEEGQLNVYPNPSNGDITITFLATDMENNVQLAIYDLTGKQVYSTEVENTSNMINLNLKDILGNYGTGLYMIRMMNGENQFVKRLNYIH